ncbi:hypothetical protein KMW28_23245 [Flammeovirga yaeyamensis]|uniref:Uncharacterized protein n=1 Tax=Flammeovirga yaeyamensis TaxID=367791 RepID=A0AAX1NCM3_9BACT|nr:hypothetical protein [Flammeovirga yaeyamensis]MBB3696715.1 TRAP-type C4-dicarboxylate transport system permease small subunit [Flammeovirga yaeyamensis]NMF33385.1 hypothetical protein [Flammeovirga yaeyamensis]QWG05340.1 hypothetical protein KMW28_23245 [Flammeovirga yaeyamensis]
MLKKYFDEMYSIHYYNLSFSNKDRTVYFYTIIIDLLYYLHTIIGSIGASFFIVLYDDNFQETLKIVIVICESVIMLYFILFLYYYSINDNKKFVINEDLKVFNKYRRKYRILYLQMLIAFISWIFTFIFFGPEYKY